jgi:transcriptional regulator with XRE-family HTH domain
MTDLNVVPFTNRMSETELDEALKRVAETYGGNRREAGNRYEQELARAFHRSGWKQEDLAKKVGKSQSSIEQSLRFGRFLDFTATAVNQESVYSSLSENAFRTYWRQTDKREGNDRIRFLAVLKLIEAKADPNAPQPAKAPADLAKDIAAGQFADGKWHLLADLATAFDEDSTVVDAALKKISKNKCKLETKAYGNSFKFRLFKQERPIAIEEIAEKLGPIVKALFVEGKKGPARISGANVTIHASRLQKLLDEWCG